MEIIVVVTATALVLFLFIARALPSADRTRPSRRLTVADIQARLAAESPGLRVPLGREVTTYGIHRG